MFGLDGKLPWFSNTMFGGLSFIGNGEFRTVSDFSAMISAAFLPETLGIPMSQTMEEAENNYYRYKMTD